MAELEHAVYEFSSTKELSGFAWLKAFRILLFVPPEQLLENADTKLLPASVVCLHLLNHAPAAVPSPHAARGMTVQKFWEWMQTSSDNAIAQTVVVCRRAAVKSAES